MEQRRARRWVGGAVLTAVLVLVGTVLSLTTGWYLQHEADRQTRQSFERRADLVRDAVAAAVDNYRMSLTLVAATAGADTSIDERGFRMVVRQLAALHPAGATSVAFVAPPAARAAEVAAQQRYWRHHSRTDLVLHPAAGTAEHTFVVLSGSLDGSTPVEPGTDVALAAPTYAALMTSRHAMAVTLSQPFHLLFQADRPGQPRQLSFTMAVPVPGTSGHGLRGWLVVAVHGQDFLARVLGRAAEGQQDVTLTAGGSSAIAQVRAAGPDTRDLTWTTELAVGGQTWRLEVQAASVDFAGSDPYAPAVLTIVGLVITVLVAGLVGALATGRARAREAVRAATAGLQASEAEATRQSALLSAVLESIADGVMVIDRRGRLLINNPASRRLMGVDEPDGPEIWSEHYGLLRPDGTRLPLTEIPLARALDGEAVDGVEMIVRNEAQPRGVRIEVKARPLEATAGHTGAVAVFRDVTSERAQQAELAAFAGVVAHDLKNPLSAVRAYLELVADEVVPELDGELGELADTLVSRAQHGAERMRLLIDDLLSYSTARDATLDVEAVDLGELVAEVVALHRLRHDDDAQDRPVIAVGPLPVVPGDPARLRQVFDNLIGNGLKYTPAGRPAQVSITAEVVGDVAIVTVADRGIGIPAEQLDEVFAPFRRAHGQQFAGTGLGLAICHRVITRHGGSIVARPRAGGGTAFVLTLPLDDVAEQAA